jgi:hypothetical protein
LLATGISSGNNYSFRVRAKNKHGWGIYSDVLTILSAVPPDKPLNTKSEQDGVYTKITWDYPVAHGSPVIEY